MTAVAERDPIVAESDEQGALMILQRAFAKQRPRLVGPDGQETEVPESLYHVIIQAVRALVAGNGVAIMSVDQLLTTQQAADLLNMSRPHLIKLLEGKAMPFRKVGTHRRIPLQDVMRYRQADDERMEAGLAAMAKIGAESYDEMPEIQED
jgi:excisionase family DNA binding protein